jgi:hypothetical protein
MTGLPTTARLTPSDRPTSSKLSRPASTASSVVSINLDESDNTQVIFETLNARGTGLGALDLVKNAVFLQAERESGPAQSLHDNHWEPTFEADDYWLEEIRQGRERRPRADWFLMHWLGMQLGQVVRADKLFDSFRKDVLRGPSAPCARGRRSLSWAPGSASGPPPPGGM